jgi:hypothetical protein
MEGKGAYTGEIEITKGRERENLGEKGADYG